MQARVVTGSDAESPWVLRSSDQVIAFHKGHASQRLLVQFLKIGSVELVESQERLKYQEQILNTQNLTC